MNIHIFKVACIEIYGIIVKFKTYFSYKARTNLLPGNWQSIFSNREGGYE